MEDWVASAIAVILLNSLVVLGIIAGMSMVEDDVKSGKLIIIKNASYRCKMIKSLEE